MGYSASDVEKVCGVKRHRLFAWVNAGWIKPSVEKSTGSGTANLFSAGDLFCIAFFRRGVEAGLSRKALAKFMPVMQLTMNKGHLSNVDDWDKTISPSYLIFYLDEKGDVIGESFVRPGVEKGFLLPVYSEKADFAISINQSKILREVQKKIRELDK